MGYLASDLGRIEGDSVSVRLGSNLVLPAQSRNDWLVGWLVGWMVCSAAQTLGKLRLGKQMWKAQISRDVGMSCIAIAVRNHFQIEFRNGYRKTFIFSMIIWNSK